MSGITSIFGQMDDSNSFIMIEAADGDDIVPVRPKKRRLDHLTWEEKLQRKKLKNRVAAQTSRDRKKAKMEYMEQSLEELKQQNTKILAECETLKRLNATLMEENKNLRNQRTTSCACGGQNAISTGVQATVDCDTPNKGSAVSEYLLPKGLGAQSAAVMKAGSNQHQHQMYQTLLKIIIMHLCCLKSSTRSAERERGAKSMLPLLSKSHKVCSRTLHETLQSRMSPSMIMTLKWWGRHQNNWNPVDMEAMA